MLQTNKQTDLPSSFQVKQAAYLEYIIHAVRIFLKAGMVVALYIGQSPFVLSLIIYIVLSELVDQLGLYIARIKPSLKIYTQILYVLNSVILISIVGHFAGWVLTDYYLIYLIHVSSATLAYGVKIGIFSWVLSLTCYTTLLYINQALPVLYLRLPLISIVIFRLLLTQKKYQNIDDLLAKFLSIERSKQDFIGLASHNLRTPVAAIYGYIDLLLRGNTKSLSNEQMLYIQRIKNNNQQLEKLTEQLLQISILEIGKEVNLQKQPSQLEIMIDDIVENFTPTANTKNIKITFTRGELLPLVNIDVEKIKAIISNLVDNAIKYTEKGEVTITTNQNKDFAIVSVQDTGVGISTEELPKIFNKFYRSENLLVYNQKGTGLGLYLGKKIAELHGGMITAESIAGKGSTLTLFIPLSKEEIIS